MRFYSSGGFSYSNLTLAYSLLSCPSHENGYQLHNLTHLLLGLTIANIRKINVNTLRTFTGEKKNTLMESIESQGGKL